MSNIIYDNDNFIVLKESNSFGDLILSLVDIKNMKTVLLNSYQEGSWPDDLVEESKNLIKGEL